MFTSESVSEGHPDKVADQISDGVLDECLRQDPESRVACEVFTTTNYVLVGGEISTRADVDIENLVKKILTDIGYTDEAFGISADTVKIENKIHEQSQDISQGVTEGEGEFKEQGAGDQGMMFGYACTETEELMPAPIILSHKILKKASELRKSGKYSWMRPDAKSQVSIEYKDGEPDYIDTVVVSHQHSEDISHKEIEKILIEEVIKPVIEPTGLLKDSTKFLINPTGRFVIGGPHGDSGLTGRKIIVDTYGGMGRHGGGAFSGKDPSKVDRSAAYMARYIAKNIVAAKIATRCEIELAYAIGYPEPVSLMVETFGTSNIDQEKIADAVRKTFDLTPAGIIKSLDLKKPVYLQTATYGHFGNSEYSWEQTDKVDELKQHLGL